MSKQYRFRSDAEWADLIRKCKSSGLSDYQWCSENGIPQSSFYRNLKKFRNTTISALPEDKPAAMALVPSQDVVPVRLMEDPAAIPMDTSGAVPAARLTVNGISIDLYGTASASFIGDILRAAASLC